MSVPSRRSAGATITVTDDYYTPGGKGTNGFDIQTPSAVQDGTAALSSDYTRADGTVFTGEKGARPPMLCESRLVPHPLRASRTVLCRASRERGMLAIPFSRTLSDKRTCL